jgi:hypothetical protein
MVVYKVIVEISKEVAKEWFKWMSTKHIPDVINTGVFLDFSFSKMIPNGKSSPMDYEKYEIRYLCRNMEEYNNYEKAFGPRLQAEHFQKYEGLFKANREMYEDLTSKMIEVNS